MDMRLIDQPRIELLYKQNNLVIPCDKREINLLQKILERLGRIDPNKDYEVSIKPQKAKRSLDANAYLWVLIGKLGQVLKKPDSEVYREYIRDNGVFQIVPIREDSIDRWIESWKHNGIGWVCEDLGVCRNTPGYHNIKCYYGGSTYTTKEMARLIDAVVWDCNEQGIDTMTPNQIEEMKQKWGVG